MIKESSRQINVSLISTTKLETAIDIPDCLKVLDNPKDIPLKGFGCIRVMTPDDGDKRVVWDSNDFKQISEAKNMFDDLVLQGLVPYCVGINGRASADIMIEFDPYAEEIVFCPMSMATGG